MRLFLHVLIKYAFSSEREGGAEVISEEFERTKREN